MVETTQTREREIGSVDTIWNLLAIITNKVCEENGSKVATFGLAQLATGLRELSQDERFKEYLKYIDFYWISDGRYNSSFITDQVVAFNIMGVAGVRAYYPEMIYDFYSHRSTRLAEKLKNELGEETVKTLESLADELILQCKKYLQN